jgi:cysteine desulfurase
MIGMKTVYFDHAATTPTHPAVAEAMVPYITEKYGNPSTIYTLGREVRVAVEEARAQVALSLGADPEEIIFTSGGTEADNHAIKGVAYALRDKGNHIITTCIEHHAVLEPCHYLEKQGFRVTYLSVDGQGLVDPDEVRKAITKETILVSVMHANNEIGTIQPIQEISRIAREAGVYLHVDAVQTAGALDVDVNALGVDLLAVSAHKLYGPKGIGCLYVRKGTRLHSFIHGGAQERKRRAGTENVAGIIGFGKAMELSRLERKERGEHLLPLRDRLIKGILESIPDSYLNGHPTIRLPNNVNVIFKYIEGESICLNLDFLGIAASTGSACSSESLEPSHVLLAIGISPEDAHGSVRFTLGRDNSEEDVDYVLEHLPAVVEKLRSMSPLYPGK